jgi:cob(I)alamin adenosyltransferase
MKIYTKKGDNGFTSLYDCSRISKSSDLIDLIGDLDELNSFIGLINSNEILPDIQIWIFDLSTIIANPKHKYLFDDDMAIITIIESEIDRLTALLPKLVNFILPSGNVHVARAVSRRCERKLVAIIEKYSHIPKNCLIFLNRLSDYLFTLARFDNMNKEIIYRKSSILTIAADDSD